MQARNGNKAPPQVAPERLARILRHEVGDLLQTVYATVAILQERLSPDLKLERRILGDLRGRAEICKQMLDMVHDLVCPLSLALETVDPAELVASLASSVTVRFPKIDIRVETQPTPPIQADPRWLTRLGTHLLVHACERAQHRVQVRSGPGSAAHSIQWTFADDGPPVDDEQLAQMLDPFQTTRPAHSGLELGLARRLTEMHGGRMMLRNQPEAGLVMEVVLPETPPASDGPA